MFRDRLYTSGKLHFTIRHPTPLSGFGQFASATFFRKSSFYEPFGHFFAIIIFTVLDPYILHVAVTSSVSPSAAGTVYL